MQLSAMVALTSQRLNEGTTGATFYPTAEIVAAINEGSRLLALLTLCLEKTVTWTVAANTTFFRMLTIYSDWVAPLRIADSSGNKIRPSRFDQLSALSPTWIASSGTPTRYAAAGVDLLALYSQPSAGGTNLTLTYAYSPPLLVSDADVPLFQTEYHPQLVNYAVYRLRQVEGLQEFQKVLPLLDDFLKAATQLGNYVRARNLAGRYDKLPFELEKFDRSKLLKLRKDIVPERTATT